MRSQIFVAPIFILVALQIPAQAVEVFKLQVVSDGHSGTVPFTPIPVDTSRQEWIVITVNGRKVQIRHSTTVANFVGMRSWFDHPATLIRLCVEEGFEHKNCQTTKGDTATLPKGKTIYDMGIDFKYVEGGVVVTRNFQLSPDFKPEQTQSPETIDKVQPTQHLLSVYERG
jgi:sulfur carrier protein ThiS